MAENERNSIFDKQLATCDQGSTASRERQAVARRIAADERLDRFAVSHYGMQAL